MIEAGDVLVAHYVGVPRLDVVKSGDHSAKIEAQVLQHYLD
jgi:hypothetical protein